MEETNEKILKSEKGMAKESIILIIIPIILVITIIIGVVLILNAGIKISNDSISNTEPLKEIQNEVNIIPKNKVEEKSNNKDEELNNFYVETYMNKDYYISNGDYKGEYNIQFLHSDINSNELYNFDVKKIMTYSEYEKFCKKWNLNKKYNSINDKYIVFSYTASGRPSLQVTFSGLKINNKNAVLYIWDEASGVTADVTAYVIVIPTNEDVNSITIQNCYSKQEYNQLAGISPLEGYSSNLEKNKELAKQIYINTSNENVKYIVNKMLDAMASQHTIHIDINNTNMNSDRVYRNIDLIESISVLYEYGIPWNYKIYNDENTIIYSNYSRGGGSEFVYNVSGTGNILRDMFYYNDIDFIADSNPTNSNKYDYHLTEDDKCYIIETKNKEYETDNVIVYINKNTLLIEKTIAKDEYNTETDIYTYTDEIISLPENVYKSSSQRITIDKPIIYIYPTEETAVTVELGNKEQLTCTYPIYKDKWEVLAKPDGTLIDEKTGKSYYALYWEGKNSKNYFGKLEEGFVVKGEDTISFLEEKLEILGLNEREAEEFIVYWLPKMQNNKYNYIRFQTEEEIEKNMPLNVTPKPETVIRIMMEWKGLNNPIEVKEQVLEKKVRSGYTIVEWGGTEIK